MSEEAVIFEWDPRFETGLEEMDRQHRSLVGLINSLGSVLLSDSFSPDGLDRVLEQLEEFADTHFACEESLMAKLDDRSGLDFRSASHSDFLARIGEARLNSGERPLQAAASLLSFLLRWLLLHISDTDRAFPGKSPEAGCGNDSAARLDLILPAMNRLFDILASRSEALDVSRKKLEQEALARQRAEIEFHKLSSAVSHSPMCILVTDSKGIIEYVNPKFTELTGYSFEEAIGKKPSLLASGMVARELYREMWKTISSGQEWRGEFVNRKRNGELYWDQASISPVFDSGGKITHYVSIQENITESRIASEHLRQQKEFSDVIIISLPGIFYMLDQKGNIVRVNRQFPEVLGRSEAELLGTNALDLFVGEDRIVIEKRIAEVFEQGDSRVEANLQVGNGRSIPYYFTGHRTMIDGKIYLVGLGTDITDRRVLEKQLLEQARTDMLTGLPNRRHFMELAESECERANRYGGPLSLMMIDLDGFKHINDTHGHQAGDQALAAFAEACRKTIRVNDIPGRIGGEEFAVILPETDGKRAFEVAERLRRAIAARIVKAGQDASFGFTASIGIATRADDSELDRLIAEADRALYSAKSTGKNRTVLFRRQPAS